MSIVRKKISRVLLERGLVKDLEQAQDLITAKQCVVDGAIIDNINSEVSLKANIEIRALRAGVSRGGEKLLGAIKSFQLNFNGSVCADLGASTGGFTEQLLLHGAVKVYAVDTAKGELDWSLRSDDRVEVWEGTNAAHIESFPEEIDFISVDISLVPLKEFLPAVYRLLKSDGGRAVLLIKPQYELESSEVPAGGVVSDEALEEKACERVKVQAEGVGFLVIDCIKSPTKGRSGNQEYLLLLQKGSPE